MLNYYEDTMPLVTNENDYLKYFIDESLPLFDKLNIIIKKGQPFQRQALLNHLNIYINSSLFKPLIKFIISEIETWDIETILLFPKCLHNLLIKYLLSLDNELFNIIFKHMITSISSGNEKLSKECIYYFDIVIDYYTQEYNNKDKKFPFIIENDIYQIIFSLGIFGQSPENMRLCCYLTSCMCRIIGHDDENENIQKMFNRICLLFCDVEKTTETQNSRELKYLIPIFKEKILGRKDIIDAIKSYINHDSDHIIQTTIIISLLINIKYISNELKQLIVEKIKEIFDDNNYEDEYKNNILDTIINSLYSLCLECETSSNSCETIQEKNKEELQRIVNQILDMKFMKNFLNIDKVEPLLIINFEKIKLILNNCTLINCNRNNLCVNACEEGIITIDNIFIKIYLKLFPKNYNNNTYNDIEEYSNGKLQKLFIINLYKIIPCLNSLKNSKILYEKINHLFKKDTIINNLKYFEEEYTSNNNSKNHNYLYKLLLCLLQQSEFILNNINKTLSINNNTNNFSQNDNYYIKLFHNILYNTFSCYNQSPNLFTNQIHFLMAMTIQKIIKQVYKYHKYFTQNNKDKSSIDNIYDEIYNNYLFNIIKNQNFGNYIQMEYINIFPYLMLYGKNRHIYFNFIEEQIIKNPLFFTRRYSINFIEKCFKIYSFNLFIKFNLLDLVYNLINDSNNIISASIIDKILLFHKKIIFNSNDVFLNICKTLSKINQLNKDNKSVSIKNFDIEKNRTIKKILNIGLTINNNENNKSQNFNNNKWNEDLKIKEEIKKIKERETKLILRETEIFGKGYQSNTMNIGYYSYIKNINNENNRDSINSINKNKNRKNNSLEENISMFNYTQTNKTNKRKSLIEKSNSSVMHNLSSKNNSKKFLPKIKQNSRKYSSSNSRKCDITFNNNCNINNKNRINNNTLNIDKLIISFKDKSPDEKNNLKSINPHNNRLPSANSSKKWDSLGSRCLHPYLKGKNIFYQKYVNNLFVDDNNFQILSLNEQNNIVNNFMRHSGRISFKDLLNSNELPNNVINGSKSIQSSKNVNLNFKNGFKNTKFKKDNYFNISNKITINAKSNEINKSNK